MSGNPIVYYQTWANTIIVVVGLFLLIFYRNHISKTFIIKLTKYLSVFLLIFCVQYFTLGFVSIPFVLGFCIKVFSGAIIFQITKERFAHTFLNVMFWMGLISFPFYILHFIIGDSLIPHVKAVTNTFSIGIYTFRPFFESQELMLRNSGFFWEPGVYQGYLILCLFFNYYNLPRIWANEKIKIITIIFFVISTMSTTGYILLFILIVLYLLAKFRRNIAVFVLIGSVLLFIAAFAFNNLPFLGNKILMQQQNALTTTQDYTVDRFGSFLLDWHYIQKHPIFGNGFHEKTKYADHPEIIQIVQDGKSTGLSNGLSSYVASAGLLGMLWYFYFMLIKRNKKKRLYFAIFILLIIILLLGEPLMILMFYLGLPFIYINQSRTSSDGITTIRTLVPKKINL